MDITRSDTSRSCLRNFNEECFFAGNCCRQHTLCSSIDSISVINGSCVPLINKVIAVEITENSGQGDFAILTDSGIISCDNNLDAVVHIYIVRIANHTAAVGVGNRKGEHVGIRAVCHVGDLQGVFGRSRNVRIVFQVTVGQHPLVAQLMRRRVISIDVRTEFKGCTVANHRVAFDHNRRVRICIDCRVFRGNTAFDV